VSKEFFVFYKGGTDNLKKAAVERSFKVYGEKPSEWNDESLGYVEIDDPNPFRLMENWFKADRNVITYKPVDKKNG
jgi:hypothetical protein